MSKITLLEAKEILKEIELVDAFASMINKTIVEDKFKLQTYTKLQDKIYRAERDFGIDLILNQIKILKKEAKYYDPIHSVFYYKENISNEYKEANIITYNIITNSIKSLKDSIEEISKHIYIQVEE